MLCLSGSWRLGWEPFLGRLDVGPKGTTWTHAPSVLLKLMRTYHHSSVIHSSAVWQVFVSWKSMFTDLRDPQKNLGKLCQFTCRTVLFCVKFNWNDLNDLCKVKYWVFLFLTLLSLVSHGHINDYLSKSHCLLTRYEGFLDTIMTAFDSLDNI